MNSQSTSLQDYKLLLYQALAEPIGLLIHCSDFANARGKFYTARNEAEDPQLAQLQFRASPGLAGGNLIIVKQKVQLAEVEQVLLEPEAEI